MNKRFWAKVDILDIDSCWNWKRGLFTSGYGQFWNGGTSVHAHRYAYEDYYNTKIPSGKLVCHKCDNRKCCNPNHFFVGSQSANMQDASNKKRLRQKPFYNCKQFRKEDIDDICQMFINGHSSCDIGRRYNIDHKTARRVFINREEYERRCV